MLPAHYQKKEPSYFCRFTFGQFFTLLVLEIFTLFFIFYLGSRYGRELLGIVPPPAKTVAGSDTAPLPPDSVHAAHDPEIQALAKDILETAPSSDLKQRVAKLLEEGPPPAPAKEPPAEAEAEAAPAAGTTAVIPTAPPKARFSIQVGSYTNPDEAHAVEEHWKQKGYLSFVLSADLPDRGRWYRVRVGAFQTKDEAQNYLNEFTLRENQVDAFIAAHE